MSDADRYTGITVVGPDTAAALTWLRSQQGWERRLTTLRDGPDRPGDEERSPLSAA